MTETSTKEREIQRLEDLQTVDSPLHRMSPVSKLLLLVVYIILVTSYREQRLLGLIVMILFPVTGYQFALIPVRYSFIKFKYLFLMFFLMGIFNPVFDRKVLFYLSGIAITSGMISMISLFLKGAFCLMATFLFIATTRIEDLCQSLDRIHFPKMLVSLFYLTYRYLFVLIHEAAEMVTCYQLRGNIKKGVRLKDAGSFLGQLLLRTVEKGERISESMSLRGYRGDFYIISNKCFTKYSWLIVSLLIALMGTVRIMALRGVI